jgi:rubrerythrin
MAKKQPVVDSKKVWLCEECGTVHDDIVDPPDDCRFCGYRYFSNLHDLETERAGATLH